MSIKKILKNKVNIVVVPGKKYNQKVITLIKGFSKKNICYVTVNKAVDSFVQMLKKGKVKTEYLFFIDCITKTIVKPEPRKDTIFCSSPNALTEISLAVNKIVDSGVSEVVVIDSLSSMLVYHKSSTLMKFVFHVINKVKSSTVVLVLLVPSDDKETEFYNKLIPLADNVVKMK